MAHLAQISSAELTFFQVQVQKLIKIVIKVPMCSLFLRERCKKHCFSPFQCPKNFLADKM